MNPIFKIFRKEMNLYFHGTGFFLVSVIFSFALFLLFRFTYPAEAISKEVSVSIIWAVHLLSGLFTLLASQEWEWESGALRGIKVSSVDAHNVFLGKSLASAACLSLLWVLEMTAWVFLYVSPYLRELNPEGGVFSPETFSALNRVFWAGILTSAGISFLGQITGVLAIHSRFRHILLFIFFFPLALPSIITGSSFTRLVFSKAGAGQGLFSGKMAGLELLSLEAAFAFLYLTAGVLLYEILWEE